VGFFKAMLKVPLNLYNIWPLPNRYVIANSEDQFQQFISGEVVKYKWLKDITDIRIWETCPVITVLSYNHKLIQDARDRNIYLKFLIENN